MYQNRTEDTFGRHPAWWGFSAPLTAVHRPHALKLLLQLPLVESPALGLSGYALNAWVSCKFHMPILRAFDGTFESAGSPS